MFFNGSDPDMHENKNGICFQWLDPCPSERLRRAQEELKQSVLELGLEPVLFPAGSEMVKFRAVLQFARDHCPGDSFVWCNSDVVLRRNPYEVDDGRRVHGFHRTELPSGEVCGGVDMYLIPRAIWDEWLSGDSPDLWCGATHIDWWLTNAACLRRCYESHAGFIDHLSHETSGASKSPANCYYRHNIRAYNKWARRHGSADFRQQIRLPFVGATETPLRDIAALLGLS